MFQTGRDVDAVAQQIIVLDHHIAEVDPDAEGDPAVWGHSVLPLWDLTLHSRRTRHRVDDGPKLRNQTVA